MSSQKLKQRAPLREALNEQVAQAPKEPTATEMLEVIQHHVRELIHLPDAHRDPRIMTHGIMRVYFAKVHDRLLIADEADELRELVEKQEAELAELRPEGDATAESRTEFIPLPESAPSRVETEFIPFTDAAKQVEEATE